MEYFALFNLQREPFGNSPDPEMFYHSVPHRQCLHELETAIRLRRGLNVVIGEIGTGKSTLCRQLIRNLNEYGDPVTVHLLLEPEFATPREFLLWIAESCGLPKRRNTSDRQIKEMFKNYLFEQGADQPGIVTLIIDEGQKLPGFCLEILREFLNYETNQHKLLQIVIFAQEEFLAALKEKRNFADRIAVFLHLKPLSFSETRELIRFRLQQAAGTDDGEERPDIFTLPGYWALYRATGGYPRKIVMLCSRILLSLIIQNRTRATLAVVRSCAERLPERRPLAGRPALAWAGAALLATAVLIGAVYLLRPPPAPSAEDNAHRELAAKPVPPVIAARPQEAPPDITETMTPPPEPAPDMAPSLSQDNIIEQRLAATTAWLQEVDRRRLTIQLAMIRGGPEELKKFLTGADNLPLLEHLYLEPLSYRKQPAWKVFYHDYPDQDSARSAIAALPASLQRHRPFIRPLRAAFFSN